MSYLLDTNIFIWLMEGNRKINPEIKRILKDLRNEVFISVATVWEIVIKKSKGKLKTPENIEDGINQAGFKIIPIEIAHVLEVEKLPIYEDHRDPFDHILITQARIENFTLVTADPKIWKYKAKLLKA